MGSRHEAAEAADKVLSRAGRRYLYGVSIAATGLLAAKGLIDDPTLALINGLIAAVLGVALVNVPVDEEA